MSQFFARNETGAVEVFGIAVGDDVPVVSELQWTLGARCDWILDAGRLLLNVTYKYEDEYFAQAAHQQRSIEQIPDRAILNAGLRFFSNDEEHQMWLNDSKLSDENDVYGSLNFSGFLFNNTALPFPTEPVSWEIGY